MSKKVLIVDDDSLICEQLAKELQRNFFETHLAYTGRQAWEFIETNQIDVVLLDLKLPDMDGLDLLKQIKDQQPAVEVVVVTGYGTQEIAVGALRRGAIDYIEKPIDLEQIGAALGRAIEKIEEKKELAYKSTILVIDDDKEMVARLRKILEKEGYATFGGYSGCEGLEIIGKHKIDVVITDVKMGPMSGLEVLKKAKGLYQDIEVIMVTGYGEQELAVEALRAGAIDYLQKPVNLDELIHAIAKAIERINLYRTRLYRNRELKISSEIVAKMNEELERLIAERTKKLTQTQAQLFQTSKLATLGEMAAGLAHEINQPLGGIALVAKNMSKLRERNKLSDAELERALADIDKSVRRMTRIIEHIRTFARQDTLRFIQVDINEPIESALSLLGEQLRLHEIEVVKDLAPDLPKIMGEPYQIEQVIINLVANARDALDSKGEQSKAAGSKYQKSLTIKTESLNENISITVADNGAGMPPQIKEKIFNPFFTTKEVGKATGLGLSISYGIIQNHQGTIEVESEEGKGAVFKVKLPVK
ncbi:MAG: response regulator [Elusimicrobia bacterium]|nr:response regulator [Elusimicrobiota bacterium]